MKIPKQVVLLITILAAIASIILILFTNYQIMASWFGKAGPSDMGSIEVSYVTMGKMLTQYFGKTWIPFWYFGFPMNIMYTPLLPYSEFFLSKTFNMPLWEAYRLVSGIGYIIAPVSLFFLGWQLSKRVVGGAIAGMLFTVSPTLMYWFNEGVANDKISLDFLDPRRFTILTRWGEGPHTTALMFVPLVGACFARFLEKKNIYWLLLASIFLGMAGLTNAIGLMASLVIMAVMMFVKLAQDHKRTQQYILSTVATGLIALGLISFWYNASFIKNFFAEGGGTGQLLKDLFPWGWVGGVFLIVAVYWLVRKVIRNYAIAVSLLLFSIFFSVVLIYYNTRTELLPQALRYNVEADMSLSLLIGVLFAWFIGAISRKVKVLEIAGNVIGVLIVLALFSYIQPFIYTSNKAAGRVMDIKKTGEYDIANWLNSHVDPKKGERVFLPGNYGFYLDWFSNVWQHRGALYQASIHPWAEHMHYQMATGKKSEIAHAWLVISNSKYAVITDAGTREMYKEIKYPERFMDYDPVYEEQGDTIYEVPLKRPSTAKPVSLGQLGGLQTPKKGDDKEALISYASWVEDSSQNNTDFTMIDNDTYQIKGTVGDGEGILVQMAYHKGWKAKDSNGNNVKITEDPLGFMVLHAQPGDKDITLTHGKTTDEWLGYFISFATGLFVLWLALMGKKYINLAKETNEKEEPKEKDKDYE